MAFGRLTSGRQDTAAGQADVTCTGMEGGLRGDTPTWKFQTHPGSRGDEYNHGESGCDLGEGKLNYDTQAGRRQRKACHSRLCQNRASTDNEGHHTSDQLRRVFAM